MKPEEIIEEVKKSGLRGRGGLFPTGLKWSFMPKDSDVPSICCNGDESESGSFKDRAIFEFNPHQFIEGTLIACFAMGIKTAYVYIRGEYSLLAGTASKAIDDGYSRNYIGKNIFGSKFSVDIYIIAAPAPYAEKNRLL
jgi:NADH-quinone oxidoreductase subunit F